PLRPTPVTQSACPWQLRRHSPVDKSQYLRVRSALPDRPCRPSPLTLTEETQSPCPEKLRSKCCEPVACSCATVNAERTSSRPAPWPVICCNVSRADRPSPFSRWTWASMYRGSHSPGCAVQTCRRFCTSASPVRRPARQRLSPRLYVASR